MSNKDKIIEGILQRIDRDVRISEILETKVNQDFIDEQVELFIATLTKDLEKYE